MLMALWLASLASVWATAFENTNEDEAMFARFIGHPLTCRCPECSEDERLRALKITHDAPTGALDSQSVSLRELVDNATLTLPPRYPEGWTVGEDWNDD